MFRALSAERIKSFAVWHNRWLGAGLAAVVVALIAIASLAWSVRQPPRFMFPVGILVTMIWIIMLKNTWRYVAMSLILATNMMYFLLGSHDSYVLISSSRAADSLAGSLLSVMPHGSSGIVVGADNSWIIGGGSLVDMGPRKGDTFSTVNLGAMMHIDPFIAGRPIAPELYDFGLAFDGFGPHRTARYRWVSVDTALILAGVSSVDKLPVKSVLGRSDIWTHWQWRAQPDQVEGAVKLEPSTQGWCSVPASDLDGHWLVYRARTKDDKQTPMRLQVNWHAKPDNRFISSTIQVVYPNETWYSYATLLNAPPDADIGYVYAKLHSGAKGMVEVQSIELK
ncbi:MAG: hypothetical protein EXR78_06895 [Deltaproteobacteria bacterium]|nr:hypothetical protein [Deltaproteobacteria bacterium]